MPELFTIGHSRHSLETFVTILHAHDITHLVDVRTIPKSRIVPWFNKEVFKNSLAKENIAYTYLPLLGGLRQPSKNSINLGWKNASFRGYADYMQSQEFHIGLDALNNIIHNNPKTVIMCAEALPWRCHRSLIADAEIARNYVVWNIMNQTLITPHKLTKFAVVNSNKNPVEIYYPKE